MMKVVFSKFSLSLLITWLSWKGADVHNSQTLLYNILEIRIDLN